MATAILIGKGVIGREKSLSSSEKIKKFAYGIEWDESDTPLKPKRIGNLELHKTLPIQNALRGCVAQNGNIMYYLDENGWAYKQDGTPSRLDGYDGEIQVEIPKFYLWHEEEGTIKRVYISLYKIVPYATEIPHMLMDAYRATVLNKVPKNMGYLSTLPVNSAISVANTEPYCRGGGNRSQYDGYLETDPERSDLGKPRTSITRSTFRTYARNAHKELMCFTYYWAIFYWLYVIEYANFNSQATFNSTLTPEGYKQGGLGAGVTTMSNWAEYNSISPITPLGYNNNYGNGTGINIIKGRNFETLSNNYYINQWNRTNGTFSVNNTIHSITITSVTSSTSNIIYTSKLNAIGTYTFEISGLSEGQSLVFKQGNDILAIVDTDGIVKVTFTDTNVNRSIFSTFTGSCNITITTSSIPNNQYLTYSFNDLQVPRWRGFDNPFGDIWTNLEGVIIETDPNDNTRRIVYTTTNPELFGDTNDSKLRMSICGYISTNGGYTTNISLGNRTEFLPKSAGTNKYNDYFWGTKSSGLYAGLVGGAADYGSYAGLASLRSNNGVGNAYSTLGFRSLKILN